MIGQLRGQLVSKKPNLALVDVNGVGYEVHIPLTSFYELPEEGNEVRLRIHTHVREDAIVLDLAGVGYEVMVPASAPAEICSAYLIL